ncbi:transcription elongation factor S-II [Dasineura jujubifolia toursvirus 2a]|nr:transcription elongation factor S-II [Dasineura jujubifolia toursvirus 2a]
MDKLKLIKLIKQCKINTNDLETKKLDEELFENITKNKTLPVEWNKLDEILGKYILYQNTPIKNINTMYQNLSTNIGFDSICFDKYKNDENCYLNFLECPEVDEGMFECRKCKSKKIFTMSKQTRSGDEATTVFARCSQCKFGWIVN